MHKTIQCHWKRSRLNMGRTPIAFSGQYKPDRTLIMSTGAITGRIQSTGRDKWGRWSYQSMIGRNGRIITIISVYQPVATNKTDQGSCTVVAYFDQRSYRQSSPSLQTRLNTSLTSVITQDGDILFLGDFDEHLGDDLNGIYHITEHFQLVDIMANLC